MLEMIKDTDKILATNISFSIFYLFYFHWFEYPNFMLGTWTHRAQQFAHNEEERRWLDFNAKNQITRMFLDVYSSSSVGSSWWN